MSLDHKDDDEDDKDILISLSQVEQDVQHMIKEGRERGLSEHEAARECYFYMLGRVKEAITTLAMFRQTLFDYIETFPDRKQKAMEMSEKLENLVQGLQELAEDFKEKEHHEGK
jgi:hypothetical protein